MNDTMIVFSYIQQSHLKAATIFCTLSMALKIQSFNNLIQLDIAYSRTAEGVKVLPTSCLTESLAFDQHAAKKDFSWDKSTLFSTQQENAISTTF